jgi:hypothetical protein
MPASKRPARRRNSTFSPSSPTDSSSCITKLTS